MLTFENMAAHDKAWPRSAPTRLEKIIQHPRYTDSEIVTNISNIFLRPTAYSQI